MIICVFSYETSALSSNGTTEGTIKGKQTFLRSQALIYKTRQKINVDLFINSILFIYTHSNIITVDVSINKSSGFSLVANLSVHFSPLFPVALLL